MALQMRGKLEEQKFREGFEKGQKYSADESSRSALQRTKLSLPFLMHNGHLFLACAERWWKVATS